MDIQGDIPPQALLEVCKNCYEIPFSCSLLFHALLKLGFDEEKIKPEMWPTQGHSSLPTPVEAPHCPGSFILLVAEDGRVCSGGCPE